VADTGLHKAFLVGVARKGQSPALSVEDSLEELAQLGRTADLEVAGRTWQSLPHPDRATYVGKGKVHEIADRVRQEGISVVVFDDELAPSQQRNVEEVLGEGVTVMDRTRLILEIFSRHAHSREGKLQVELAQYRYLLPRLAGLGSNLSQQTGGTGAGPVGLRGPGETKLEMDRRNARGRITRLAREIEDVRAQRGRHRERREKSDIPMAVLVGYTNSGKSTLLNHLTGAGVLVEDKLFATLDPTTRRLRLPAGREALLTDTVGFIRKLPTVLVAAFRATLEGIEEADLILQITDGSHPHAREHVEAVDGVLADLDVASRPRILVWNKIDREPAWQSRLAASGIDRETIGISARTGENVPALLSRVEELLRDKLTEVEVSVPFDRYELLARIYAQGAVLSRKVTDDGIQVRARVPQALAERLKQL
jgi:GTPase